MASNLSPRNMDGFLPLLAIQDTKNKLTIGSNLITYLDNPDNDIECSDIGQFIDSLIPWMQSSNYKVSQNGIEAMTSLVDKMGNNFRVYIPSVLPPIIDRLGDSKEMVREKSQLLILKLLERDVISPQVLFDKLAPSFAHKNGKIREEVMNCLLRTLGDYGAQSIAVSRLIPAIVKLLSDPISPVRDAAFNTLVEIYRHVGDRLRMDLQKKHNVPQSKLPALMSRFDEIRENGELLPTANGSGDAARNDRNNYDEPDASILRTVTKQRANSVPRKGSFSASKVPSTPVVPVIAAKTWRANTMRRTNTSSGGQAGAVDEDTFSRAFEDVPTVQLFSARELEDQLNTIRNIISDANTDWSKRVDALKKVRSLLIAGASGFDELFAHLRLLEVPFQTTVRDLRSQVVREACYTIAFLCEQLAAKMDHFAESLLPNLIFLIQNSAKVMASAGVVTVRFIIRYTHSPRLIPIITTNMSSKSKEIRKACCDFLEQLLTSWPTHTLERHIALLQEAIKKGVADADVDTRLMARKAYWSFSSHFREQAEALLNSLDPSYKRALNGDLALSNSSSTNSLNQQSSTGRYGSGATTPRVVRQVSSAQGSTENLHQGLHRTPSLPRQRSGIPVLASGPKSMDSDGYGSTRRGTPTGTSLRSNSAIDLQAAQRAKARAQYAALARLKVGSGASLPRPRKSPEAANHVIASPERVGRTRGRMAGVSQSQPSSRSGSPSSRLSYATYASSRDNSDNSPSSLHRPRRMSSGIPRSNNASRDASRETSPSRGHQSFSSKLRGARPPTQSPRPVTVMAQKILQQSREAESALADALTFDGVDGVVDLNRTMTPRKTSNSSFRGGTFEDHSDESETSSVCSERSFDSFRRPSDTYSWSGSQQRLYRDLLEPTTKDIVEIITHCASTHWSDRKEGLVGLQSYFQNGNALTGSELKKITEIFTKMFMDAHTKVFSLFLDTLNELILTHKADLHDWLYILLTRLLNKLGADLLGSIQNKIHKSLAVVRDSFPHDHILAAVMRFIVDPTQTPNAKVKVATLSFLTQLTQYMDPAILEHRDTTATVLAKIIVWSGDQKSTELRKASQTAVMALFNLNTPQITMVLASLPKEYQEAAATFVHHHFERSRNGSLPSSPLPLSPPHRPPFSPPSHFHHTMHTDSACSPEDVYSIGMVPPAVTGNHGHLQRVELRSLRRTTAEIQAYSFEPPGSGRLLVERDTTSQDSGISQMSIGPGDKLDTLEERMEDMHISQSGRSSSLSSPTHRPRDYASLIDTSDYTIDPEDGYIPTATTHADVTVMLRKCCHTLSGQEGEVSCQERKVVLYLLQRLLRDGNTQALIEQFKPVLRVLLSQIDKPEASLRSLSWTVLTEMFRKAELVGSFHTYIDLLMLKVLSSHKDEDKEVVRSAETCAGVMGAVLPPEVVIKVLKPLIKTGDFPVNQGAIKMLTRVVEQGPPEETLQPHIGDLMHGLIEAYDHKQSPVRKCAVFCIVALHGLLGEEKMAPYLKGLVSSKLKLLHLYIRRTEQGASAPTSPKNAPP